MGGRHCSDTGMMSTLKWLPKGAAKQFPHREELTEQDVAAMRKQAGLDDGDAEEDEWIDETDDDADEAQMDATEEAEQSSSSGKKKKGSKGLTNEDVIREFDMDHYDSE